MRHRNPWLMTDERMGDALWPALRRLPPGSGIVFRHHATPRAARMAIYVKLRRIATARRLAVITAGRLLPGAHGVHHGCYAARLKTWPIHDRRETAMAQRAGARIVFVSPVYPTRSHPAAPALGAMRAARLIPRGRVTAIALGGMTDRRWQRIRRFGFHGWAAIDAWTS